MVRGIAGRYSRQPDEPAQQPATTPPRRLTEGDIKWAVFVGVFWALVLFSIVGGLVSAVVLSSL